MVSKRAKILVAFGAIVLVVVLAVSLFDWNILRGAAARYVSEKTGRAFAINGDLNVKLSMTPLIEIHDVILGNAPWGTQARMAEVARVAFRIDLRELFSGRIVLPYLELSEPTILLETNAENIGNWQFTQNSKDSAADPSIGELRINKGRVGFRPSERHTAINLAFNSDAAGQTGAASVLRFSGEGFLRNQPFSLAGRGESLLSLQEAGDSYRINVSARAGNTEVMFQGALVPFKLETIDGQLKLSGKDLSDLYPMIPTALPWTPPYSIAGRMIRDGEKWTLQKFTGKVGDSDLSGDFSVDRSAKRPSVVANLVSRRLSYIDLGGFVGAVPGGETLGKSPEQQRQAAQQAASGRVFSSHPYNLERLRASDADVRFRGEQVIASGEWPLDNFSTHLRLQEGELKFLPLDFGVAGGHIVANLTLDARKDVIRTSGDATVRNLELKRMLPKLKSGQGSAGKFGGRFKLATAGNSIAEMAGAANGELALMMAGGQMSTVALLLSNIDLANVAATLLFGEKNALVRCVVVSATARDGIVVPNHFVADTSEVNIRGEGKIDLRNERYDLTLTPDSKRMSVLALRGPIAVGGTFKNPNVGPVTAPLATRAGTALALAAINPFLALVPLFDPGDAPDSNCAGLIQSAKKNVSQKAVPKPAPTRRPNSKR